MSANAPNADIDRCFLHVGLGPEADIGALRLCVWGGDRRRGLAYRTFKSAESGRLTWDQPRRIADDFPGLVRSADLIGQLGDINYSESSRL
jgi:hypothetical protein